MRFYSLEEFKEDVQKMAVEVKKSENIEAIVAVARGGLTFGHCLAEAMLLREVYALNSRHYELDKKLDTIDVYNIPDLLHVDNILVVDDIIDSGETMVEIIKVLHRKYPHLNIKTASIFYKDSALMKPDFAVHEAKEWIKFFWDHEL